MHSAPFLSRCTDRTHVCKQKLVPRQTTDIVYSCILWPPSRVRAIVCHIIVRKRGVWKSTMVRSRQTRDASQRGYAGIIPVGNAMHLYLYHHKPLRGIGCKAVSAAPVRHLFARAAGGGRLGGSPPHHQQHHRTLDGVLVESLGGESWWRVLVESLGGRLVLHDGAECVAVRRPGGTPWT